MLCAAVLFTSCRRDDDSYVPDEPKPKTPFSFTVQGSHDTTLEQTGEASVMLRVKYVAGEREIVTLSPELLPAGVITTFDAASADEPPFNTYVKLHAYKAPPGIYPVKIRASSLTGTDTVVGFNLEIKPYSNPAYEITGEYIEKGDCTTGKVDHLTTITVKGQNEVEIYGFYQTSYRINATINPAAKTITIPKQTVLGVSIEGSGTYTAHEIKVNYQIIGTTINEACTTTFTEK